MMYNIIKWTVLILLILTLLVLPFIDAFWIFWMGSGMLLVMPRMQDSLDRIYCGKEMTQQNIKAYDIYALLLILFEIFLDTMVYLEKHDHLCNH